MRRQSESDRAIKCYSKRSRRQEVEVRRAEQEQDTQRRQQARRDEEKRHAEQHEDTLFINKINARTLTSNVCMKHGSTQSI